MMMIDNELTIVYLSFGLIQESPVILRYLDRAFLNSPSTLLKLIWEKYVSTSTSGSFHIKEIVNGYASPIYTTMHVA